MQPPLTFKTGKDAFEYTTKYFSSAKLRKNDAIYGLVTRYNPALAPIKVDEFVVSVSVKKKGLFSSGSEILSVAAILDPDAMFRLDIKIGDLVLWGCVDPSSKPNPFGVIVEKCQLYLDDNNEQFVIAPNQSVF